MNACMWCALTGTDCTYCLNNPYWAQPPTRSGPIGPPWLCPKCGRVYAGQVSECYKCNEHISEKEGAENVDA